MSAQVRDASARFSEEAEQSVISAVMAYSVSWGDCGALTEHPEWFYRRAHQLVWKAIEECLSNGVNPGIVEVGDILTQRGELEEVGGYPGLSAITSAPGQLDAASVRLHTQTVVTLARERIDQYWREKIALAAMTNPAQVAVLDIERTRAMAAFAGTIVEAVGRYRLMTDEDVENMPAPAWLLGGVLVEDTLSVVYGEYGSAKSFLTLDWALCVATGTSWHGRAVERGTVVYIAGEGIGGLGKRIRAWKAHHRWSGPTGLRLLGEAPQLLSSADILALRQSIETLPEPPKLIVIDTLARSMAGADENSAQDMGLAVANAEGMRAQFKCHVLLVHHKPNGAARTRGSTALPGAAATLIDVTKDGDTVTVTSGKQKDYEKFSPMCLMLNVVALDEDASETSCVLIPTGEKPPKKLPDSAQAALAVIQAADALSRSYSNLKRVFQERTGKSEATFDRALTLLQSEALIENHGGMWTLTTLKSPS